MRRERLPILEPCGEDWTAMTGDERRRHCSACARDVLHLSAMTAAEARQALAAGAGERVCVRYTCDADGEILFAPRPRRALRTAALVTTLAACTASEPARTDLPAEPAEPSEPAELCDPVDPPVLEREVDDGPALCEAEPEPPHIVVEVEVDGRARVEAATVLRVTSTWTGIPAIHPVAAASLPAPALARPATPPAPRRVRPLDAQMGAVTPDPLASLPTAPRREE